MFMKKIFIFVIFLYPILLFADCKTDINRYWIEQEKVNKLLIIWKKIVNKKNIDIKKMIWILEKWNSNIFKLYIEYFKCSSNNKIINNNFKSLHQVNDFYNKSIFWAYNFYLWDKLIGDVRSLRPEKLKLNISSWYHTKWISEFCTDNWHRYKVYIPAWLKLFSIQWSMRSPNLTFIQHLKFVRDGSISSTFNHDIANNNRFKHTEEFKKLFFDGTEFYIRWVDWVAWWIYFEWDDLKDKNWNYISWWLYITFVEHNSYLALYPYTNDNVWFNISTSIDNEKLVKESLSNIKQNWDPYESVKIIEKWWLCK